MNKLYLKTSEAQKLKTLRLNYPNNSCFAMKTILLRNSKFFL